MRQRTRLAAFAVLVVSTLAYTCGQSDPDRSLLEPAMGRLVVTAVAEDDTEVAGVPVLVDGAVEGRTPLSLMLSPGTYAVSVDSSGFVAAPGDTMLSLEADETAQATFRLEAGYPRTVVIEEFTNSDCQGCPEFEERLGAIANDFDEDELVVVSVHTNIPGADDPMLDANTLELLRRSRTFYGIGGIPSGAIDGTLLPGPPAPSEDAVRDSIADHGRSASPVRLDLTCAVAGDVVTVEVTVRSIADVPGDYRLLLMTVQSEIAFGAPPGVNGQSVFHHVVRDLAPDNGAGTPVGDPITITAGMDETRTITANVLTQATPPDDVDRLECVVVLQDWSTRTILQTVRATPASSRDGRDVESRR